MIQEKEVGTFEAKNKLSSLLDEAARGKRIWITKRGKRVALLSSGSSEVSSGSTGSLCGEFRRIRGAAKPGDESLKELIEAGRR